MVEFPVVGVGFASSIQRLFERSTSQPGTCVEQVFEHDFTELGRLQLTAQAPRLAASSKEDRA